VSGPISVSIAAGMNIPGSTDCALAGGRTPIAHPSAGKPAVPSSSSCVLTPSSPSSWQTTGPALPTLLQQNDVRVLLAQQRDQRRQSRYAPARRRAKVQCDDAHLSGGFA
jgi:hypothetical protein